MPAIPWGGFFGLIVGRIASGNGSTASWGVGIVAAWVAFLIVLFTLWDVVIAHIASFIAATAPFWVFRKR